MKDGSQLDLNEVCPSCEAEIVKTGTVPEELRQIVPQAPERRTERRASGQVETECLRKDVFVEEHLARKVAREMRRRHRGSAIPVRIYRCQVVVDPLLYPERAQPHWHIGGR